MRWLSIKKPGHIDSEKPEAGKKYKTRYLEWNCPHQKSVEKPFNELLIPAKPPSGTKPLNLEGMGQLQKKISITASKIINKNCTCNLYYESKYSKKPLITSNCSGTYQEPSPKDPLTVKPIK